MIKAIREVQKQVKLEYVLSDAMPIDIDIPIMPIIKGDTKSMSIAAANVIAKVTRNRILYEVDKKHSEFGFKNHKGYPTKKHLETINKYGLIGWLLKNLWTNHELYKRWTLLERK